MDTLAPESTRQSLCSQRLNLLTNEPHQRLEDLVKSKKLFANRGNFACFVATQYLLQHDPEPLYRNEALTRLFPGLASCTRDGAARADLADLGHPVPKGDQSVRETDLSLAEALGWLFVPEGSKLGAAFLSRKAAALELDENFGARHLAEPKGGRAWGWKSFMTILGGIELNGEEERLATKDASDAFSRFDSPLECTFAWRAFLVLWSAASLANDDCPGLIVEIFYLVPPARTRTCGGP